MNKLIGRTLVATMTLAAALASPALARTFEGDVATADIVPARYGHAQSPQHGMATVQSPSDAVVYNGRIVGRDPDPSVRQQILRDAPDLR
ncbi:hypothetical protein [Rhodoplanes sp. SY1]|uniref:hypothetical protein n=1 Tax=Rhodoplanes sp. SY1 TaxID=3166646 RepID=UPI0038B5C7B1